MLPIRKAKIKSGDNIKCWARMQRNWISYTAGGTVKWYSHSRKQFGSSFKKLNHKMQQLHSWALNPERLKLVSTQMFITALSVTAKNWKQPE